MSAPAIETRASSGFAKLGKEQRLLIAFVLSAAILCALPWLTDDFTLKLVNRMLIFGLAAMSVDLLVGFGGLVPLGHAAFMGLGAYTAGMLTDAGVASAFIVWPLAMLVGLLAALVIGSLSLRSSGLYFIMITLAFAQMIYYAFQSLSSYGGDDGFSMTRNTFAGLLDPDNNRHFYLLTLGIVAFVLLLLRRVVVSEFGVALRAARDNAGRLSALGLPAFGYRLAAFAGSGAIGALSGAMLANLTGYITPSYGEWQQSGELLVMALLGGSGTIYGGLIGAAILLGLSEFLSDMSSHWMFYLGLLIVLRVLLVGEPFKGWYKLLSSQVRPARD